MDLILFILGIAILILIHELGHFMAARMLGVEVEEFGLGFPPRAVKLFEHNGTIYSLNWIPLGGFVRPKGENDPSVPGGLAAASPWVRLGVLVAGPLMNLLAGVVLAVMFFYSMGDPITNQVLIEAVAEDSPAAAAGLMSGDLVLEVNNQKIDSTEALQSAIAANAGSEVSMLVLRGNETLVIRLTPRANPPEGQGPLGVGLGHPTQPIGLVTAVQRGATEAYRNVQGILMLPVRLISGQASPEEGRLVGYKGMYDIFVRINERLWFFMAISISLGVMNLLPIPALDGGRILLTLPEILIRKRVPAQYENMIHLVGFAMLILLLIYINVQDFINPLQLP
jgi:regulator of sigma E protease